MKAYRINLRSWTASFRYPNLISGFQPSLPVPPLSTLFGLISAAKGHYVSPNDVALGFLFKYDWQNMELETIYQFNQKSSPLTTKPNIIWRQVLFDTSLWLYINDADVAESFKNPSFQLLIGRSSDLCSVFSVDEVDLDPIDELNSLKGTVVPMSDIPLAAPVQALPIGFTNDIPRSIIKTQPFFILDFNYNQNGPIKAKGFYDPDKNFEIYWHNYT